MNDDKIKLISYLYDAGNLVENNILRSYYFTKCSRTLFKNRLQEDKNFTNSYLRCPKCRITRDQTIATYKIKAGAKDKFLQKLTKKNILTKFQAKYLKKSSIGNHNTMIITCQLCGHISKKKVEKPKKPVTPNPPIQSAKKKKKKQKDKFSGLNIDAVLSIKKSKTKKIKARDMKQDDIIESNVEIVETKINNRNNEKILNNKKKMHITQIIEANREKNDKMVKDRRNVRALQKKSATISVRAAGKVKKKNKNKLNEMFSKKTKASNSLTAFLKSI